MWKEQCELGWKKSDQSLLRAPVLFWRAWRSCRDRGARQRGAQRLAAAGVHRRTPHALCLPFCEMPTCASLVRMQTQEMMVTVRGGLAFAFSRSACFCREPSWREEREGWNAARPSGLSSAVAPHWSLGRSPATKGQPGKDEAISSGHSLLKLTLGFFFLLLFVRNGVVFSCITVPNWPIMSL